MCALGYCYVERRTKLHQSVILACVRQWEIKGTLERDAPRAPFMTYVLALLIPPFSSGWNACFAEFESP